VRVPSSVPIPASGTIKHLAQPTRLGFLLPGRLCVPQVLQANSHLPATSKKKVPQRYISVRMPGKAATKLSRVFRYTSLCGRKMLSTYFEGSKHEHHSIFDHHQPDSSNHLCASTDRLVSQRQERIQVRRTQVRLSVRRIGSLELECVADRTVMQAGIVACCTTDSHLKLDTGTAAPSRKKA